MSDDSDFCDDDMYSYDDGEFFAEACSRADALAALGYDQEDFDNDEENLLGYEVLQSRTLGLNMTKSCYRN